MTLSAAALLLSLAQDFARDQVVDGAAKNGMTWHVRVPAAHAPKKPLPALVVLHGSNMNAKAYVDTVVAAWPKLAADFVLVGINGEQRVKDAPADNPAFNYTYVSFVGKSTYQGFPGTDRESPALIAEVVQELKPRIGFAKVYVGGHSQGAFCAYSCFMNYPDLFAGAFPVSGGLIMQCEPSAYAAADVKDRQRRGALAIVHGEDDGVVDFDMSRSAHDSFLAEGFPALRLFSNQGAGHRFALLPVEPAIRWLQEMTSGDAESLVGVAEGRRNADQPRDALAAAERAKEADARKKFGSRIKAIVDVIDRAAAPEAKRLAKAMAEAKDDAWVKDFTAFRSKYEHAPSAKPAMEVHRKLQEQHDPPAKKLFFDARGDFQSGRKADGYAKYEELVKKYYASTWYRYARSSLDRR